MDEIEFSWDARKATKKEEQIYIEGKK